MVKRSLSTADEELLGEYPRDFATIPTLTNYGEGEDAERNKADETARMEFLEAELGKCLKLACETKERPIFTIALIAGDVVILDALHKNGLLDKVKIIYVDTFTLFPETAAFLHEVEEIYSFKADVFQAKGYKDQEEYEQAQADGKVPMWDYSKAEDVTKYDELCKVEPLKRALSANDSDCWINGRRRDHGAERAAIAQWEGKKLNPLAFWTFEDCWLYLRRHSVKYHPLHDKGFPSIGDIQSTLPVDTDKWMKYEGERSGRFQNMKNADGSSKTECGIHSAKRTTAENPAKKPRLAAPVA